MIIEAGHWSELEAPATPWVWPHATPREIACRGTGRVRVETDLLDVLEDLRDLGGRPLHLNSVYRSPAYNARVGGAPLSRHKVSDAADISLRNWPQRLELLELARRAGFRGFGLYGTFLHADLGRPRTWGRW